MRAITLVITILLLVTTACANKQRSFERRAYDNSHLYNGQVVYKAPKYWHRVAPGNLMRVDEFEVVSSEPSKQEMAVLSVYVFPGDAGGVDANINRWTAQFKDDANRKIGHEEKFNIGDLPITTISVSGTYLKPNDPTDPSSPKTEVPHQRLTAAVVELRDSVWFFKLLGEDDLVHAEKENFNKFVDSFRLELGK